VFHQQQGIIHHALLTPGQNQALEGQRLSVGHLFQIVNQEFLVHEVTSSGYSA